MEHISTVDIGSVTEAPASGYATSDTSTAGHTYAIQLSDGTYALIQPTTYGGTLPSHQRLAIYTRRIEREIFKNS